MPAGINASNFERVCEILNSGSNQRPTQCAAETEKLASSKLGPTAEFLRLKQRADDIIVQGPPDGQSQHSLAAKERVMEAIKLYT